MAKKRNYQEEGTTKRLRQLKRVLVLAGVVQLYPMSSIEEIAALVGRAYEGVCLRTIRRDMAALEELGVVESRVLKNHGKINTKYYTFSDDQQWWPFKKVEAENV